jgi:hypothetical protein
MVGDEGQRPERLANLRKVRIEDGSVPKLVHYFRMLV